MNVVMAALSLSSAGLLLLGLDWNRKNDEKALTRGSGIPSPFPGDPRISLKYTVKNGIDKRACASLTCSAIASLWLDVGI